MGKSEGQRLAEFSRAVRESTLKRLVQVPAGQENWRPVPGVMSFADIAHHINEADRWLFQKLDDPKLSKMVGAAGEATHVTPEAFSELVVEMRGAGELRADLFAGLNDEFLDMPVLDDRFGQVSIWWVIVRGNLDHEIHHRGQLATYLRVLKQ